MAVKRWNGTAWEVYAGADLAPVKVTDGRVGKTTFIGATSPTGQVDGDIWIDQDTTTNAVVPTALTTKGDIFAATGNAAYTRFAAGNNGESLYADSTTSTGLRWQGDFNTGKNKVINGDFGIWQRGTSFTNPTDNTYVCDRFKQNGNGSGFTKIWSRQAFTPGTAPVAGYESPFFFRFNQTVAGTGGTNNNIAIYVHEDVRTFAGQTVTLSFWAKADASRVLNLYYGQEFNNSGTGDQYPYISSPTLTTSWTRYTFTFTVASISGKTIGTGFTGNFQLVFNAANNITQTIDLWGIQLEAGSVATPFTTNTANPQAELAACQRYFQIMSGPGSGVIGSKNNGTTTYFIVPLKVNMRAAPSMTSSAVGELALSALNGSTTYPATSFSTNRSSPWSASFGLTQNTSDGTAGSAGILLIDSGSGWVAFSAEL
jgi:hypothetical protein